MKLPIYLTFADFKENYKSDLADFLNKFPDANENDFKSELLKLYLVAQTNVTFADVELQIWDLQPVTIAEFYGEGICEEVLERIKFDGLYDFERATKLNYSFKAIIKDLEGVPFWENTKHEPAQHSTTEPYKEKEIGSNIPYKLALLDEMGVIQTLNTKFTNKTDIYKILQFLTGGNIDNVKNYYNSIYGNYSGTNQITEKHRDKAKEFYYK